MQDDQLILEYIELNPQRPEIENARLKEYGVSVWALIGYLKQAACGDADRVATDYEIPIEAVQAAMAFYRRHRAAIDARIAANSPDAAELLHAA